MFPTRIVARNAPDRWRSLIRVLGIVGFIAFLVPGSVREPTGRQALHLKDGTSLIGSFSEEPGFGESSFAGRIDEVHASSGFGTVAVFMALRRSPGMTGEMVPGGELYPGRLVRRVGQEEVEVYGQKQVWAKIRTLDGVDGYALETPLLEMKAGTGIRVRGADAAGLRPEMKANIPAILAWPFRFLIILNLYLVLYLPGLLLGFVYLLAAAAVYPLGLVHALVLQKNHEEFDFFFRRFVQNQFKLGISFAGWTGAVPHIDLFSQEKKAFPAAFAAPAGGGMSREDVLLRLVLPFAAALALTLLYQGLVAFGVVDWFSMMQWPRFFQMMKLIGSLCLGLFLFYSLHFGGPHFVRAFPHIFVLAWMFPAMVVVTVVQWAFTAVTGRDLGILSRFQLHYWRCKISVQAASFGIVSAPPPILTLFRGGTEQEGTPPAAPRISMNLIVLLLLIVLSAGIYGLFWLARVARLMADDPFTMVLVTIAGGSIPLSFLLARYYRRAEILTKVNPSIVMEILVMIPGTNLILGPFVVQYLLNQYEKTKSAQPV